MYAQWKKGALIVAALALLVVQGCAVTNQKVDLIYRPSGAARGGSGDVYLVRPQQKPAEQVQYVLGKITNRDGEQLGSVVSDLAPSDIAFDALSEELRGAGYRVIPTTSVPADADKALTLNAFTLSLDEVDAVVKQEAHGVARIKVEAWRNGKSTSVLGAESAYQESAPVTEKGTLLERTLQKTMELSMKNVVPDVVKQLESR